MDRVPPIYSRHSGSGQAGEALMVKAIIWLLGVHSELSKLKGIDPIAEPMIVAAQRARDRLASSGKLEAAEEAQRRIQDRIRAAQIA